MMEDGRWGPGPTDLRQAATWRSMARARVAGNACTRYHGIHCQSPPVAVHPSLASSRFRGRPKPPVRLDPYVIDTLLPDLVGHDRQPSAFLVYLLLWRLSGQTDGRPDGCPVEIALQDVAERTGLSKRGVQDAIARLVRRGLLAVRRDSITAVGAYTVRCPWAGRPS